MRMSKLTLTAPAEVIAMAKQQAKMENSSISTMFVNFILAKNKMAEHKHVVMEIGPITKSLCGIVKLPDDFDEKEYMTDCLMEKYGLK